MKESTIVLVEDNPGDVTLVQMALEEAAIPTTLNTFARAKAAREHFQQTVANPDLLLLDINLTDGNGLDLLAELRTQPHRQSLCAIVLSSSVNHEDRERATRLGVVRFIEKPLELNEFLSVVGQAVYDLLSPLSPYQPALPTGPDMK